MAKPSFLCIGGQRCGTTRLHRILDAHPEISMTQRGVGDFNKEIHYFDRFVLTHDLDWYESHFSCHGISGEITPAYSTLDPAIVKTIGQYLPEIKIIYIVRNPVDRIWSQIRMMQSAWNSASIHEFDFKKILRLFDSPAVCLRSDYLHSFSLWQDVFGTKNILLLTFDELMLPKGLEKIFNFLQVNSNWLPPVETTAKVLSSPALDMPNELRWLCAESWLPMLDQFSALFPSALSWLVEMKSDSYSIPKDFIAQLEELRAVESDALSQQWLLSRKNQESLSLAMLNRLYKDR